MNQVVREFGWMGVMNSKMLPVDLSNGGLVGQVIFLRLGKCIGLDNPKIRTLVRWAY